MFRHERPQKGRFRQFHQINAEIFGDPGPRSDADIINLSMQLFERTGMTDLSLNINSLGCPLCRSGFKDALKSYLKKKAAPLCPDCTRRSEFNPLRIFDCKVQTCGEVVSQAPSILDFICDDCADHFKILREYLESLGITYVVNHRLVRGLDYYSRTTFEIQTEKLGAQNAVAGGGRYDGLVKQLGGPDHPGIGFAIGIERMVELMGERKKEEKPELFIAGLGDMAEKKVFCWVNELRKTGLWVEMEYGSKGLKAQMKKADRIGAKKTLIVGDNEIASGKGILRDMETKAQQEVGLDNLVENLKRT
jgi:histidyl-tRNA synthetase